MQGANSAGAARFGFISLDAVPATMWALKGLGFSRAGKIGSVRRARRIVGIDEASYAPTRVRPGRTLAYNGAACVLMPVPHYFPCGLVFSFGNRQASEAPA